MAYKEASSMCSTLNELTHRLNSSGLQIESLINYLREKSHLPGNDPDATIIVKHYARNNFDDDWDEKKETPYIKIYIDMLKKLIDELTSLIDLHSIFCDSLFTKENIHPDLLQHKKLFDNIIISLHCINHQLILCSSNQIITETNNKSSADDLECSFLTFKPLVATLKKDTSSIITSIYNSMTTL